MFATVHQPDRPWEESLVSDTAYGKAIITAVDSQWVKLWPRVGKLVHSFLVNSVTWLS